VTEIIRPPHCDECFKEMPLDAPLGLWVYVGGVCGPPRWICPKCSQPPQETRERREKAFRALIEFVPEVLIEGVEPKTPFFSEAWLYELLGKEDARTILCLLRQVKDAFGVPVSRRQL
jgi:hypothetical protein